MCESVLSLNSKIPLKVANIYEAHAVKNLGIRLGRIISDLWKVRLERTSCAATPVCCLHRLSRPCPAGPLDIEGGITEQRLLELAGSGPERRGPQREERTLCMGRESAGAIAESLHSGDIIYRTQRDLVSNSHQSNLKARLNSVKVFLSK